nr:hypothetical protein CFP56_63399 [Quercus suber]POE94757.1 hypothetical protein CFP56_16994 [Quercus suber]
MIDAGSCKIRRCHLKGARQSWLKSRPLGKRSSDVQAIISFRDLWLRSRSQIHALRMAYQGPSNMLNSEMIAAKDKSTVLACRGSSKISLLNALMGNDGLSQTATSRPENDQPLYLGKLSPPECPAPGPKHSSCSSSINQRRHFRRMLKVVRCVSLLNMIYCISAENRFTAQLTSTPRSAKNANFIL